MNLTSVEPRSGAEVGLKPLVLDQKLGSFHPHPRLPPLPAHHRRDKRASVKEEFSFCCVWRGKELEDNSQLLAKGV